MAVLSTAEIIAQLTTAAANMRAVRSAAQQLRSIRTGAEPNPTPLAVELTQPNPGFLGEPIRTNTPTT